MAHRLGTLEKDMRDLKTNAASQPSPASASQQFLNDAMAHRVGTLEPEMRDLKNSGATKSSYSASASQQPQDDAMAASCASSSLPHKRKTCQQYRVPAFRPMRVNGGKCQWCERCWSKDEFQANYDLDKMAWEQAMTKLFYGFEATEEGLAGGLYDFIESSGGMPYNVQHSLEQLKTLSEAQGVVFSNLPPGAYWEIPRGRCRSVQQPALVLTHVTKYVQEDSSVRFCSVMFCSVLVCVVMFCYVLLCCVVFCDVMLFVVPFYHMICLFLFYSILYYCIRFCSIIFNLAYYMLFYSILCYSVLFCAIRFYSIRFDSMLFYAILCYSMLFCAILCYSMLFYAILCYSVLFDSILFYSI